MEAAASHPHRVRIAAGRPVTRRRGRDSRPRKALTIGAVCKVLGQEFDDISISKIRYLEDQKLLAPRRTRGGYRLYSQADVEQLRAILRMQRDEFLPLRVIRQELAAGKIGGERGGAGRFHAPRDDARGARRVRRARRPARRHRRIGRTSSASSGEFGIVQPERRDGDLFFDETDVEIVRAATELARFGVQGRNLRVFRSSADREASLLEQIMGPSLRSRSPARRQEALENLEGLAATCTQLKHLLLVRDLRRLRG